MEKFFNSNNNIPSGKSEDNRTDLEGKERREALLRQMIDLEAKVKEKHKILAEIEILKQVLQKRKNQKKEQEGKKNKENRKEQAKRILGKMKNNAKNAILAIFGVGVLGAGGYALKANASGGDIERQTEMEEGNENITKKTDPEKIFVKDTLEKAKDKISSDVYNNLGTKQAKERYVSICLDTANKPEKAKNNDLIALAVKHAEGNGGYSQRNDGNYNSPALGAYQERYLNSTVKYNKADTLLDSFKLENDNEKDRQTFLNNPQLQETRLENRIKVWEESHPKETIAREYGLFFAEYFYDKKGIDTYLGLRPDEVPDHNSMTVMEYINKANEFYRVLKNNTNKPGYWIFDDKQETLYSGAKGFATLDWYIKGENSKYKPCGLQIKLKETNPQGRDKDYVSPIGDDQNQRLVKKVVKYLELDGRTVSYQDVYAKYNRKGRPGKIENQVNLKSMTEEQKGLHNDTAYALQYRENMTADEFEDALKGKLPGGWTPGRFQRIKEGVYKEVKGRHLEYTVKSNQNVSKEKASEKKFKKEVKEEEDDSVNDDDS